MRLELDMTEFNQAAAHYGALGPRIRTAAHRGLLEGARDAAQHVSAHFLTGQSLKRRTGNLARAVDSWSPEKLHAIVGVRPDAAVSPYKWLLGDETKTIRPKNAKFLAIPIGEGLTPSGVARYNSPRDVPGGFFFRSQSGQLLFGMRKGKTTRAKVRPLFVMVKEVTIHGTGALADGVLAQQDQIVHRINDRIGEIV